MDNNIVTVVGNGVFTTNLFPGQEVLAKAITDRGFNVEKIESEHPRDAYVHFKDKHLRKKEHGKHAEGGMILTGTDYLLVSENAFVASDSFPLEDAIAGRLDREAYRTWTKQRMEALYQARVHVIESETFLPQGSEGHLDYSLLLLPHAGILIIDDGIANKTVTEEAVQEAVRTEKLEVMHHGDPLYPDFGHPVNALVLSDGDKDVVFYDRNAKGLGRSLRYAGVESIPINFPSFSQIYGVPLIHCSTNTYHKSQGISIDFLVEPIL